MKLARIFGVMAIAGSACGHETNKAPAAPQNQVDPKRARSLVARANDALAASTPNDYAMPFAGKPADRSRAIALYLEACKSSEASGCWMALQLSNDADKAPILELVDANCRAGDMMSCRALPSSIEWGDRAFPDAPGAAGRSEACSDRDESCDRGLLRNECDAGFPESCHELGMTNPPLPDHEALLARGTRLATQGCEAGLLRECRMHTDGGPPERACLLDLGTCDAVARADLERNEPTKARDMYERACQYSAGSGTPCADLGSAYLDRKLPEPVPGRGQALIDWACPRVVQTLGAEKTASEYPACKRASHR